MAFGSGSGRRLGEINVTPFVDVVLVLLVIFMVTAPMLQTGVEVQLPKTTLDPIPTNAKPTVVSLTKDGRYYLGDTAFKSSEIDTSLVPLLAKTTETIYVRSDEALPYGDVARFLGKLHAAGIKNVSLVTEAISGKR